MITVAIFLNKKLLFQTSARRIGLVDENSKEPIGKYRTDEQKILEHKIKDGAKILAQKMLENSCSVEEFEKKQMALLMRIVDEYDVKQQIKKDATGGKNERTKRNKREKIQP